MDLSRREIHHISRVSGCRDFAFRKPTRARVASHDQDNNDGIDWKELAVRLLLAHLSVLYSFQNSSVLWWLLCQLRKT